MKKLLIIFISIVFLHSPLLFADEIVESGSDLSENTIEQEKVENVNTSKTTGDPEPYIPATVLSINKKNIEGIQSKNVSDLYSGAGVYSLPLEFPKGPLYMVPKLVFSYNSYSTDAFTPYGYAWSLNILRINRSSKKGISELYNNDDFVVDGEELLLVNTGSGLYESRYTNNLNKYYLENNSWRVVDTKGNTYYYGLDNESKLIDPDDSTKIFSWNLNKQVDNRGNEMIYSYFKDNNQSYIDNITYAEGLYKIKFNYIDKATSLTSYRTQFEVKTSKLLSSIVFYSNNQEVKRYELSYDDVDEVFSHLTSFKEKSGVYIKSKYDFIYGIGKDTHLLKEISDSRGLKIDFEYKLSVFYKDSDGSNLNPNLPFNVKTLHKITYLDTITNLSNIDTFKYSGGAYYFNTEDLYGRQYAGFNKTTKTNSLGLKEVYYFHQGKNSVDNPEIGEFEDHISKKGKTYRKEVYDSGDNLIKSSITKWTTEFDGDRWKTLKDRETNNLINGVDIVTSTIEYRYDDNSNIIEEINYGEVNLLNQAGDFSDIFEDKRIKKYSYAKNDIKNLYGFISSEELYDYANTLGYKKEYKYDELNTGDVSHGDITSIKTYTDTTNYIEEKMEYNSLGLLEKSINPRLYETSYTYDNYSIYPTTITNPKGFIEKYEYDYKVGKVSKRTDINGLEILYDYDNFGRLLSEKVRLKDDYKTKEIVYDDVSLPNKIKQTSYFDETGGGNKQEFYIYNDSFGRPIQTSQFYSIQGILNSKRLAPVYYITNKNTYDFYGNLTYTSYPKFENFYSYTELNLGTELGDTYTYDELNRVKKISNTSGDISYTYYNLGFTITNQKDISTNYSYDIYGNLLKVIEPGNLETIYSYNSKDQLIKIVDAENNLRNINYDLAGRRLQIEDLHTQADTNFGVRIYEYDANSNINKYTTMSGDDIVYTYDELDRLKTETYGGTITDYKYDIGPYAKGKLSSYTKPNYSEDYAYDIQGNLISDTKIYPDDKYVFRYNYNLAGQKIIDTYPDNTQTNYTYENGIATWINYDGTDLIKHISYNPVLKIEDLTYGNDAKVKNVYDYENKYRLDKKGLLVGTDQYGLTDYSFDNLGNIIRLQETGSIAEFQKDVNYSYDDLNRLTQANYSKTEIYDYTYSDIGNITNNSRLGNYNYDDNGTNNPHAVTSIGAVNYSYDDNGNVLSDNLGTYTYNLKDELKSFTSNSGATVNYNYDKDGIRIEKSNGDLVNRYITKDYELEQSLGTNKVSKYIWLGDQKLVTVDGQDIIYHHSDHLGGANIDLDSNGNILQNVDYLPFGQVRTEYNYGDYDNKYKFTGKERDTESNLDYFEARYYGSDNGRFRSIDRVFWEVGETQRGKEVLYLPQKQNSYTYSRNNPLKYIDSNGEYDTLVDALVAGGGYLWGKVTGDKYLVEGAKNMLIDTGKNAFNPVKKLNKAKKVKKIFDKVDNSSPKAKEKLSDKLSKQEAVGKGDIEISKNKIGDDKYKIDGIPSYDKKSYTHEGLDGTRTRVHYMENSTSGDIKDIKIKNKTKKNN